MRATKTVTARADDLAALIEERLGVGGRGLDTKLRRAGRRLPRWVRREAVGLVEAQRLTGHPKLMMRADPVALDDAYRKCESWLQTVEPSARRKARIINFLGLNAANLLIVSGAFVGWMTWAGHL